MDTFYMILGLFMFYAWGHSIVVSLKTPYKKRSDYHKFLTWFAIATALLSLLNYIDLL